MFALTFVLFITLAMRGSVVLYYFRYYVGNEGLFSAFNVLGTLATIVGDLLFSKGLAMRYGKRNVFIAGLLGTTVFTLAFLPLPPSAVDVDVRHRDPAAVRLRVHDSAAVGDDGRRRRLLRVEEPPARDRRSCSRRVVFALKAGLGFGGAITGYVLAYYGYVPNVAQSRAALDAIRYTMSVFPAIGFALLRRVPAVLRHRQGGGDSDHRRAQGAPEAACGARARAGVTVEARTCVLQDCRSSRWRRRRRVARHVGQRRRRSSR